MNEEKEREEARKAQVLAQKKLANKEIEKFRERVSIIVIIRKSGQECPSHSVVSWCII